MRTPAQTPNTEMTPKTVDWSRPIEGGDCLPPSCNSDETAETVDWSQPVEGGDCPPPCGDSDEMAETVDWSQPTKEDLRDLPVLDSCVQEFLSGTGPPGGDETDQSLTPEVPFDDPQEWVRWHAHWVETPAWWPEHHKVPMLSNPMDFAKRVGHPFSYLR